MKSLIAMFTALGLLVGFIGGVIFWSSAAEAANFNENYFNSLVCAHLNGQDSVVIDVGGKRLNPDCVTSTHAYEADWAHKMYEGIGQSLFYARNMNFLEPGIIFYIRVEKEKFARKDRAWLKTFRAGFDIIDTIVIEANRDTGEWRIINE